MSRHKNGNTPVPPTAEERGPLVLTIAISSSARMSLTSNSASEADLDLLVNALRLVLDGMHAQQLAAAEARGRQAAETARGELAPA